MGKVNLFQINKCKFHNSMTIKSFGQKTPYKHFPYSCIAIRFESTGGHYKLPETFSNSTSNISILTSDSNLSKNDISPLITDEKLPVNSDLIPEPPPIPSEVINELASSIDGNVIGSLASQGLGGWWPPGLAQEYINFLHTSTDLPWWLSICVATLIFRCLLFPLVIKGQRYTANLNNHLPQMQLLQLKMTEARQSGNQIEAAQYGNELVHFMKEKNLNPLKGLILPLVQAPIFISFFMGLRGMASLPMESMKDGGTLWFTDLTLVDNFYILPILTSATLYLTIHFAVDGIQTNKNQLMYYFLRAMPVMILPFMIHFPTAVLCYWFSSNIISLGQVLILKVPAIREKANLPPILKQQQDSQALKKKGFIVGFKEAITNSKITKQLQDRERLDEIQFRRAGAGPIPKTYNYDPTKQNPSLMEKKTK